MRDLVALSALPAIWAGYQPRQVAEGLADALLSALRLDLIYLRLPGETAGQEIEEARIAGRATTTDETQNIGRVLAPCLDGVNADSAPSIANPAWGGPVRLVIVRIGGNTEAGVLVAGSRQAGYPSESDRLLLSVGANHAAAMLQRQRAEEALRESEERWRSLAEALPQFVWTARPDGFMDYGSAQIERYMGCTESEVLGWGWLERLHPDDRERTQQSWQAAVDAKQSEYEIEHRFRRFDGTYRWFKTRGVAVPNSEGNGYKWFGTCTDITTDKQLEAELRLANERLHLGLRGSNIAVWEVDMPDHDFQRGRRYYVNAWEQLGYEQSEVPSDAPPMSQARVHPDERAAVQEAIRKYLAGETDKFEQEHRLRHKDGFYRWMLTRGVAVRDAGGKPIRFVGSAIDITERKQLEEELRRAKEAAEAGNRAKDEFLANVSHEIRTPMNAILGMTELVLDTALTEDQRQSLKTVTSAADNLLRIIDDLLDFAKIEAGKIELDLGDFSLRRVAGDTMRALAVRAHRKGLELVCNVGPNVPDGLVGDGGRLRQVLLNLVGNAIKFTEKGEVVVQVDVADRVGDESESAESAPDGEVRLRFSVRDTGIGISREKQSKVFRAFEQEDTSTTRKYGGTGLGLTISAQLVALMGGSIGVESALGRGSTFSFTAHFGRQAQQTFAGANAAPALLHNLRVLVVDDNATSCHVMERWLHAWEMEPESVGNGTAAMDALRQGVATGRTYALILIASCTPDIDGLTLAAKIRQTAELSGSRIILLLSSDSPGDPVRFPKLHVDGQVLKPVQQDELLETICSVMSRTSGDASLPAGIGPSRDPAPTVFPAVVPLRVLVAEDSEFSAQLIEKLLVKRGHAVRVVSNGREALALANAADFDLLLLDVHMPELDGFEVIRLIREHERAAGSHLPVIALTARSRKEDRDRCLTAGMDGFLAKPIQAAEVWSVIDRVVGGRAPTDGPSIRLVDPHVLLAACGGDAVILKNICSTLRTRLPDYLATVEQAFVDQNAPRLREAAHKLSGMLSAFSTVAGGVASDLEDHAARGQLEGAATPIGQLNTMSRELQKAVGDLSIESLRQEARIVEECKRS
jgi:two-component system sensor histidine kinase/response regulator